jgi:hypothetical protein
VKTLALLALLALGEAHGILCRPQVQDKGQDPKVPKEPIRDWKYRLKDFRKVPKPGNPTEFMEIEEVTLILEGKEAIPIKTVKSKEIYDLRGVKASYFTQPEKDKISKEIVVESDRGRFDNEARTLKLEDHVRVVKKNDDEKPEQTDTVLLASSLLLRFNRMYECPQCKKLQNAPGRCLDHNLPLKEATVTSVEAERDFEMTGPEGILSGEGLVTDDAIKKEYHITKNGFVEYPGNPTPPPAEKKPPAAPEAKFSQIFSKGPLHITGAENNRIIKGHDGMRIDRIDSLGTLTVLAQDMTIETRRERDPQTGSLGSPEIRDVHAKGRVIAEGVMFEDGTSFHSTSDTLTRTLDAENTETTTLTSTGETLVHVMTGASTVESRSVKITHKNGETGGDSEFEEVKRSDLMAGLQHFALSCDHLKTYAEPNTTGKTDLRDLKARGHVVLGGLLSNAPAGAKPGSTEEPGEARADAFDWDVATQHGLLEATPFVRITQGQSIIIAPKVVLVTKDIIVLKGPKQVHLIQDRNGVKEEYRATCAGDLVLDQAAHRLWMRRECVIRTQELLLHSDRVNAILSEDGSGLESLLALGRVSAVRLADRQSDRQSDRTTLYGDRLAFRFADPKNNISQDLKVYGNPNAVAETGRMTSTQEEIRVYEKENPKTKQMVRYTESIGGPEGVTIEIEERPGAPKPGDAHGFKVGPR